MGIVGSGVDDGNGGNVNFGIAGMVGKVGFGKDGIWVLGKGGNVGFGRLGWVGSVGNGVEGNGGNVVLGNVGTEGNGGNVGFGTVGGGIVGSGNAGGGAAGVSRRCLAAKLILMHDNGNPTMKDNMKQCLKEAIIWQGRAT